MQEIYKFTNAGTKEFSNLVLDPPADIFRQISVLLSSPELVTLVASNVSVPDYPNSRFELGGSLHKALSNVSEAQINDANLWNWLAARFFNNLISSAEMLREVGRSDRWVLSDTSRYAYRHLIASPYFAYRAHASNPEKAMSILCQDVLHPGELVEQLQSTPDIGYSVCAHVATELYFDKSKKEIKRGAGGKGPGSARRLSAAYLNQIRVNLDIRGMTAQAILDILPSEFDKFKNSENIDEPSSEGDSVDYKALMRQLRL